MIVSPRNATTVGERVLRAPRTPSTYRLRLADGEADLRAVQNLRFLVFNVEFNEGFEASYETCLDADAFDEVCDHLMVEYVPTGEVVGTYRLQTGRTAVRHGYYSSGEFDLTPLEPSRSRILELGRACVRRDHRHLRVLRLLWQGIADYAEESGSRFLLGCSSLSTVDPAEGTAAYRRLASDHLAPEDWRVHPRAEFACPLIGDVPATDRLPRLLTAYLSLGAWIAGPPAIDRAFRTTDFLTILDLERLSPSARSFLADPR